MNAGMLSLRADATQHLQDGLVGAAVQRAVEGRDAAGDRRVRVDLAGADRAHRVGRAVLLVIGVQDQQDVERLDQPRVGVVLLLRHLEQHREEVLGVVQVVVGVDVRLALRVTERPGAERRHLGDHADDLVVAHLRIADVAGLGVERRQRADRRHQHAHGVRVVAEALHQRLDVLVHERVERDLVHPLLVLLLGGELAVDEQVRDLEERGVLGQLLDGVAAVLEDALVAVDVGDGAAGRRGVGEAGVVDRQAGIVLGLADLAEVAGTDGAVGDGELVLLARAVVANCQRVVLGHDGSPVTWRGRAAEMLPTNAQLRREPCLIATMGSERAPVLTSAVAGG